MQYENLGRTGLKVSRLGLGTMNFGMEIDERQSRGILDQALEMGINLIDTADAYGGPQSPDMAVGYGVGEEIIGRWLDEDWSRRDRVVLATKLYQPMGLGPNDRGLSAYHIRRACEASLVRLGTDHIDLYQMHHVDRTTPWDEIWQAMDILITQGKISYVGSSNFAGWHIATAQSTALHRGSLGLAAEQSSYSLASREIEREVIPALEHFGVGLIPYSPLGGGLLAGRQLGASTGRRAGGRLRELLAAHEAQVSAYEAFCRELGAPPADVAVAWLLSQATVSSVIVGSRTEEQLVASSHAMGLGLDTEAMQALDRIWPGPGRAPEAYAW